MVGVVALALVGIVGSAVAGLVGYAAATTEGRLLFPDAPRPPLAASSDPAVIAHGRYLVHGPAHCAQCHSTDDRAHPEKIATAPLQGGLAFEMGPLGTRYARNLTPDPATGIGALSDADVARAVRTGVMHDGELSFFMRFSAANPSDEDLVAILSYLRSIPPVHHEVPPGEWYLFGKILLTYAFPPMGPRLDPAPAHVAASEQPSVARGAYLADHVMACTVCHTAMDPSTFALVGAKGAGSLPDPSHGDDHDMEFVAPNLTSSPVGVTGKLDEDAFVARIREGRKYASSIMPWENFREATDSDLRSVYRYLKTLPPSAEDPGPTYRKAGWAPGDPG